MDHFWNSILPPGHPVIHQARGQLGCPWISWMDVMGKQQPVFGRELPSWFFLERVLPNKLAVSFGGTAIFLSQQKAKNQQPSKTWTFFGRGWLWSNPTTTKCTLRISKETTETGPHFCVFLHPLPQNNPKKRFPALGSTSRKSSFFTNPFQQNKDMLSNAEKFAPLFRHYPSQFVKSKKKPVLKKVSKNLSSKNPSSKQ